MPERRRHPDRRRFNWRTLMFAFLGKGRRRGLRRQNESRRPHYVDIYDDRYLLLWCVGILGFCALDAYLTLLILAQGGTELNPLMDFLLGNGVSLFFYGKYLLTAVSLIFILLHVNFRVLGVPVRALPPMLCLFYLALITYESWLLLGG